MAARDEAPSATGSKRESRARKPDAGAPAAAISAAVTRGGSPSAKGCVYGTLRQQALTGVPAKEELQSLASGGESSSEAQMTSDADDTMSEASAVVPTAGHAPVPQPRQEVDEGELDLIPDIMEQIKVWMACTEEEQELGK